MVMSDETLARQVEQRVEALGYELVELERAGSKARPILRVRIDVPGGAAAPTAGVTVADCTRVSRELERYLEDEAGIAERYTLEVSSPGVERPLIRPSDFERFKGQEVALRGHGPLAGRARRLEGELLGREERDGVELVRIRLTDGTEVEVARAEIARAHLVFHWKDRR
jgi:ribosome maturation factor RimP